MPHGTFVMGTGEEALRLDRNVAGWESTPRFEATLTRDHWLGVYELTAGCYRQCVSAGACPPVHEPPVLTWPGQPAPGYYEQREHADLPMVGLVWREARAACAWLGGRLPTEAEWERAGRGEDGREVPWGGRSTWEPSYCAWGNYPPGRCGAPDRLFEPVGSFPGGAGPYGHLDLVGNAAELVADGYWLYDGEPRVDPVGPRPEGADVMQRSEGLPAWGRSGLRPEYRSFRNGTRCAWDLDPAMIRDTP